MKTGNVKQLMEDYGGNAPGFDALRLIFCVIIMLWHSYTICTGDSIIDVPIIQVVLRSILPMFFFLGGFLVTGSALRLRSVSKFFLFRTFRIFPALMIEVTLSAIILGAFVTTLPLSEYYSHPEFKSYFWNMIGIVHFYLPGVFTDHPLPYVNINLWTLPPDLEGYIIMLVLIALGIIYKRAAFVEVYLAGFLFLLMFLPYIDWGIGARGGERIMNVDPKFFIFSFFTGSLCYLYADKIPIKKPLMALSLAGMSLLAWNYTSILGVLFACYFCLCLGFVDLRKFPLVKRGDYSYGIYLYGYPIQQALWHYVPVLRETFPLFIAALPLTLLFAVFSWHIIEKPILDLRKKIGPTRQLP